MKIIYLDCGMGAAGDMLTAALLELHPEPAAFIERMNALALPGLKISALPAVKCGITGTRVEVLIGGAEEESADAADGHSHEESHFHCRGHAQEEHHHHHNHHHEERSHSHEGHSHAGMREIEALISGLDLPEKVRGDALAVYALIAEAEGKVHGRPVSEIHFHEVGALDAIADIVGVSLLIHELAPDRIIASPVHVGSGHVHCAHGVLPIPAPAAAELLRGVPIYGGSVRGELCTPTGAALLRRFVSEFAPLPLMKLSKVGYGMGKKDFERANCLRAMLGETE
ncbi:MAG: LarC family nickel insertion protein [Synergistaceae bacterium]|nr:LarC family nickel insertion protein [Synergistaceae bacterium]